MLAEAKAWSIPKDCTRIIMSLSSMVCYEQKEAYCRYTHSVYRYLHHNLMLYTLNRCLALPAGKHVYTSITAFTLQGNTF